MNSQESRMTSGRLGCLRIARLDGPSFVVERLREMGFHEGTDVEVVGRLPFGGPWLVQIGTSSFALREDEAHCAFVTGVA